MTPLLVLVLSFLQAGRGPEIRLRSEGGRFWIDCRSAPLEEVLREIAADSAMELWLDKGLSEKRVSARVEAATLKQVLEEVFREVKGINYVLAFDPSNPERVTKVYAGGGGGGGRLGREPTVAASEPEPGTAEHAGDVGELAEELDPQTLLDSAAAPSPKPSKKEKP